MVELATGQGKGPTEKLIASPRIVEVLLQVFCWSSVYLSVQGRNAGQELVRKPWQLQHRKCTREGTWGIGQGSVLRRYVSKPDVFPWNVAGSATSLSLL